MKSEWGPSVKSGVVSAVFGVLTWAVGHFAGQTTMSAVRSFVVTFSPVLIALVLWLVLWVVLTVRRVAGGRDKEYQAWLKEREKDLPKWYAKSCESYEQQLRDREAEAKKIYADNSAAIQ